MTQLTQMGEAELDLFIRVDRKDGTREYFRVINGVNHPISAAEYAQQTEGLN
jgi:hypothetical protein